MGGICGCDTGIGGGGFGLNTRDGGDCELDIGIAGGSAKVIFQEPCDGGSG